MFMYIYNYVQWRIPATQYSKDKKGLGSGRSPTR